jgi:hypothetical protein
MAGEGEDMDTATLPAAVKAYLQAKMDYDSDALLATLTGDAVITDEGRAHTGAGDIRSWNNRASKEVAATYEVLDTAVIGERTVVAIRVSGNFPGSPVPLYYFIALRDGKISALTVLP